MMILSDTTIKERIDLGDLVVDILQPGAIQPASIDLRLGTELLRYEYLGVPPDFEVNQESIKAGFMVPMEFDPIHGVSFSPGLFLLGSTLEWIKIPVDLVGRIEGKSSLGRLGLMVHSTAGFVDPGFEGQLTLELYNVSPYPIRLLPGMKIAQLSLMQTTTPVDRPYGSPELGSRYQRQAGPTASRFSW